MRRNSYMLGIYPDVCTGCRTCELVCSYHHIKAYSRKKASIHVFREKGRRETQIIIFYGTKAGHIGCDYCQGEEEQLCVKYCVVNALKVKEKNGGQNSA